MDKNFNQTEVTYKESRDDAPPPQRVRENTATPQRVRRMHPPCNPPPFEWEPIEEEDIVVTSPPLPQMEPYQTVVQKQHLCLPIPNNSSQDDGDTSENNTRAQQRTLTKEFMPSFMELTDTPAPPSVAAK